MRDFKNPNIFHSNDAKKEAKGMQQIVVFEAQESRFYVLIIFNIPEIVISEDICIMISTEKKAKISDFPAIKFRYWLNAKWIKERAGSNMITVPMPV